MTVGLNSSVATDCGPEPIYRPVPLAFTVGRLTLGSCAECPDGAPSNEQAFGSQPSGKPGRRG